MQNPESGPGWKKPRGLSGAHGVLHYPEMAHHTDREVVLCVILLPEGWTGRSGEVDNPGLGAVIARDSCKGLALQDHDAVSHLQGGERGWRELRIEVGSSERNDGRNLPVVPAKVGQGFVALFGMEGDEEIGRTFVRAR